MTTNQTSAAGEGKKRRRVLYTVVMRELTSNTGKVENNAICVRAVRGPGIRKVQSHVLEHHLATEYAESIGCKVVGKGERRPVDSEFVCILRTYRSFDKNGKGRSSSTLTPYVVYRPSPNPPHPCRKGEGKE
jgi:hypothetical protein